MTLLLLGGVSFALDHASGNPLVDDGRAYSTLAKVEEMPFEELKLDKSFVADCGTDKANAPLCKTVIDLAHGFGRYVVAVGIEKAADAGGDPGTQSGRRVGLCPDPESSSGRPNASTDRGA